jgi:hypothetical protein
LRATFELLFIYLVYDVEFWDWRYLWYRYSWRWPCCD